MKPPLLRFLWVWVLSLTLVIGLVPPATVSAATLVVDDDTVQCPGAAFTSIGPAIAAAAPGDTIEVCAGVYEEQVVVTTPNLTIEGAGAGSTIIRPASPVSANTSSLFSGAPIAAIVLVSGVRGVTIRGVTVDGEGGAFDACSPGYMGVFFRAASGQIQDSRVTNVVHPLAPGCQSVLGIFVQSANSGPDLNSNVVIDGSTVDNYGKNGITCNEAGTSCTVAGNTVTGRGPVGLGDAAQNGIQIGFGAHGKVIGNSVTGHFYTPGDWAACGVLFYQGGGGIGLARGNTFANNELDICTAGHGWQ